MIRSQYYFSDLEFSDPGTVRDSNSYNRDEQLNSIEDSNNIISDEEENFENDWQIRSASSHQTLEQDPLYYYPNNEDEYIGQERIQNSEELKCVLEEVNCMICFHLVQEPVICVICEALFCKKCIYEWFIKSPHRQDCPCCRTDSGEYYNHFSLHNNNMVEFFKNQPSIITAKVPLILKKILSKIQLRCINQSEGCEEIVSYDFREKHEKYKCEFSKVECTHIGCNESFFKKDLIDHQKLCPWGQVQCRYCDQQVLRSFYENHAEQCDYRLQHCQWCNKQQFVYEILIHEHECPLKQVNCGICYQTFNQEIFKDHTREYCLRQLYDQSRDKELKLHLKIGKMEDEARLLKEENKRYQEDNRRLKQQLQLNNDLEKKLIIKDIPIPIVIIMPIPEEIKYQLDFEEDYEEIEEIIEEVEEQDQKACQEAEDPDEYKSNPSFSVTASTISCTREIIKKKNDPIEQFQRLRDLEKDLFQLLNGV